MPTKDGSPVTPETRMDELVDLTPEEAGEIFGSEYDETILSLRRALDGLGLMTDEEFIQLLRDGKSLMESVAHVPKDITVGESGPYVKLSDLITLGSLAHMLYTRIDVMAQLAKVFKDEHS